MKIDVVTGGNQPAPARPGIAPPAGHFQEILEQRLAGRPVVETAPPASVAAATEVPAAVRLQGLELTESALTVLEAFQAALADQRRSTADLEPFAAALEEHTAGILAVRDELPASHPLAGVLDRVAAVTYLEAAKFRRGDYL